MATREIPSAADLADRYVAAIRVGDLDASLRLLAADFTRFAPLEAGEGPSELHGLEEVMENSAKLNADYRIHAVQVDDPFVRDDQFGVRFAFDRTCLSTGKRETAVKFSLYTVVESVIVREEVYYLTSPHTAG